jgi:hypothetical protein
MKIKDSIIAGLITLNLLLLAFVAAILIYQSEPTAHAGAAVDRGQHIRLCTVKWADDREGLAVIDTLQNKMCFYVGTQGRKEITKQGPAIDLSLAFRHPTK